MWTAVVGGRVDAEEAAGIDADGRSPLIEELRVPDCRETERHDDAREPAQRDPPNRTRAFSSHDINLPGRSRKRMWAPMAAVRIAICLRRFEPLDSTD